MGGGLDVELAALQGAEDLQAIRLAAVDDRPRARSTPACPLPRRSGLAGGLGRATRRLGGDRRLGCDRRDRRLGGDGRLRRGRHGRGVGAAPSSAPEPDVARRGPTPTAPRTRRPRRACGGRGRHPRRARRSPGRRRRWSRPAGLTGLRVTTSTSPDTELISWAVVPPSSPSTRTSPLVVLASSPSHARRADPEVAGHRSGAERDRPGGLEDRVTGHRLELHAAAGQREPELARGGRPAAVTGDPRRLDVAADVRSVIAALRGRSMSRSRDRRADMWSGPSRTLPSPSRIRRMPGEASMRTSSSSGSPSRPRTMTRSSSVPRTRTVPDVTTMSTAAPGVERHLARGRARDGRAGCRSSGGPPERPDGRRGLLGAELVVG